MRVLPSFGPGGGGLIFFFFFLAGWTACLSVARLCVFSPVYARTSAPFQVSESLPIFLPFRNIYVRCPSGGLKVWLGLCVYIWVSECAGVTMRVCVCPSIQDFQMSERVYS